MVESQILVNKNVFLQIRWYEKIWILLISGFLVDCDLMEWNDTGPQTNVEGSMPLSFSPFEIKTFKFVTKVTPF